MSGELYKLKSSIIRQYDTLQELIIRIASVSDNILREQLREEYVLLKTVLDDNNSKYLNKQLAYTSNEHKELYRKQFIDEYDIVDALVITNKKRNIYQLFKKHRIRQPKTIQERRLLLHLTDVLKANIDVKDMEGYIVDTIGRNDTSINDIMVYVNHFERFAKYDVSCVNTIVPIYCAW
jgi:hypothetical protein